jgi:hypothetical protein
VQQQPRERAMRTAQKQSNCLLLKISGTQGKNNKTIANQLVGKRRAVQIAKNRCPGARHVRL